MNIIKRLTKFKCSDCSLEYEKEIEIAEITEPIFRNSEPMPVLCPECYSKDIQKEQNNFYKRKIKTLPERFRDIEDKHGTMFKVDLHKYKSVYVHGETGSGKTVFATFLLKELWLESKEGMFWEYPKFIMNYDPKDFEDKKELNNVISYPHCLVIDDIGAEQIDQVSKRIIYNLINHRESNKLQTIITSNYSPENLGQRVDKRISSRIRGWCEILEYNGDKRIK